MTNIARGKEGKTEFIADIRQNAAELVKSVIADTAVYKADNVSKTKCPLCGKYMLQVKGKKGRMLICQDRICGHRQPEKQDDFGFKSSKKASRINQKLISQYSDKGSIGQNLGDLLKAALSKENEANKK